MELLILGLLVGFVVGATLQTVWDDNKSADSYRLGYRMGMLGASPLWREK